MHSKLIPVGLKPEELKERVTKRIRLSRVAVSTEDNNLECRVALTRAPIGRKLIAPCGCTGSQEWVQFAELNRLRRRDPSQWVTCQTCQQKYDYSVIQANGGIYGGLLSTILDNKLIPRSFLGVVSLLLMVVLPVKDFLLRILTSKLLWQSVLFLYTCFTQNNVFNF